jgi:hypothetical protein
MIAAGLQAAQLAQRDFDESAWPIIRESRPARGWDFNVFSAIRATLMARTSGHSRIGDATEWHLKDKPAVAHRLTLTAERVSYGDNVLDFGIFEMAAADGKFGGSDRISTTVATSPAGPITADYHRTHSAQVAFEQFLSRLLQACGSSTAVLEREADE